MSDWLMAHEAIPYMIPIPSDRRPISVSLDAVADDLDGLILQGGVDVAPETYGAVPLRSEWSGDRVRDAYEIELIEHFRARGKPILGICRGLQIINVALGGTLYQDINTQVPATLVHRDAGIYEKNQHHLVFTEGSHLRALYPGVVRARINSVHHQAIDAVGEGLIVEARCEEDNIVECIRLDSTEEHLVGVQWHPEFQDHDDASLLDTSPILEDFLRAVREVLEPNSNC
jgi:putative glutamine amidotransferase